MYRYASDASTGAWAEFKAHVCGNYFYTSPLMEELWRGSNECLVFSLARADKNIARTSSMLVESMLGGLPCVVVEKKIAKKWRFIADSMHGVCVVSIVHLLAIALLL